MTCAQGLLRLLWGGGPKLECYGTESVAQESNLNGPEREQPLRITIATEC